MEKGDGSWFPQHQFDWQSRNLNSLAAPLPFGQQRTNPESVNFGANMGSSIGTSPVYANTGFPHIRVGQVNENHGWFYDLPHFRQVFVPGSNSSLKMQLHVNPNENYTENVIPKTGSECAQKRFLVFDQSGDQTTMIFSSAFGTPTKCPTSWGPKSPIARNFYGEEPVAKVNMDIHSGPISTDVFYDNGADLQSEMHEDTEELDALLYSDEDTEYSEDEEVTSTGHSPSTMTAQDEQFEGSCEDVASSTIVTKKRKLLDSSNDCSPWLMDTGNSAKRNRCSEYEDDADSTCANGLKPGSSDTDSSSGNRRPRTDKIRDTVSVLRSLIPDGEGKDAVVVLDEAIQYLKSLKLIAETSGLGTL